MSNNKPIYVGADLGKRNLEIYLMDHGWSIGHADFLLKSAAACARALSHLPKEFKEDAQAGIPVVTLAIELAQAYVHLANEEHKAQLREGEAA